MKSRVEVTTRYARAYVMASKKDKGRVLDEVVTVTGWSRDNARRQLVAAAARPPGAGRQLTATPRRQRASKFSDDALKALQKVWAASGKQCGKKLAASMRTHLDGLERHGELVDGVERYSPVVRFELLSMSAASIDRYLKPVKAADQIKGVSTTKPPPLLRSSAKIRKAGDEIADEPGFFEGDIVAHCGPTLKGEFARTVNLTDVHTGWVFTRTVCNNAHVHILDTLKTAVQQVPFEVVALRPYKKHDQATIESKNNHLVRKYAFYYRYDTEAERQALNRLWRLVDDRFNFLIPTKRPTGFSTDGSGGRIRLYDKPMAPVDRLLATNVLAPAKQTELAAYRASLDSEAIGRNIADLQTVLRRLAKHKTEQLYRASFPSALPGIHKGTQIKAS
jgi:hypothetical protein